MGIAIAIQLSITLAMALAEQYQRYQESQAKVLVMLRENRGPTEQEFAELRGQSAALDLELDKLLDESAPG